MKNGINNGEVVNTFDYLKIFFKKEEFKKKRFTWHKIEGNTIFIVNFQKSQWSDDYYMNVGIEYKKLNNEYWNDKNINVSNASTNARFGFYNCSIKLSEKINKLFNNNSEKLSSKNTQEYLDRIIEILLDFFQEYKTPELFKKLYNQTNPLKGNIGIYPVLRDFCKK